MTSHSHQPQVRAIAGLLAALRSVVDLNHIRARASESLASEARNGS
jgi:hypothetical protein